LQLDTPRNRRGWWSGKKTHEKTKEGPVRATDPSIVQYAHRRHRRADPLLICVTTAVIAKISLVRRRAEEDGP